MSSPCSVVSPCPAVSQYSVMHRLLMLLLHPSSYLLSSPDSLPWSSSRLPGNDDGDESCSPASSARWYLPIEHQQIFHCATMLSAIFVYLTFSPIVHTVTPIFPIWWNLTNPSCTLNLELLASTVAEIIKFWGVGLTYNQSYFFENWISTGWSKKSGHPIHFCYNFSKWTPILNHTVKIGVHLLKT